jgi:hypothetical protein
MVMVSMPGYAGTAPGCLEVGRDLVGIGRRVHVAARVLHVATVGFPQETARILGPPSARDTLALDAPELNLRREVAVLGCGVPVSAILEVTGQRSRSRGAAVEEAHRSRPSVAATAAGADQDAAVGVVSAWIQLGVGGIGAGRPAPVRDARRDRQIEPHLPGRAVSGGPGRGIVVPEWCVRGIPIGDVRGRIRRGVTSLGGDVLDGNLGQRAQIRRPRRCVRPSVRTLGLIVPARREGDEHRERQRPTEHPGILRRAGDAESSEKAVAGKPQRNLVNGGPHLEMT